MKCGSILAVYSGGAHVSLEEMKLVVVKAHRLSVASSRGVRRGNSAREADRKGEIVASVAEATINLLNWRGTSRFSAGQKFAAVRSGE